MKKIIIVMLTLSMVGCGWFDRKVASVTGSLSEVCHKNVVYVQATSGVSVAYNPDGTIMVCEQID